MPCEDELLKLCTLLFVDGAARLLAQLPEVDESVELARRLLQLQLLRERDVLGDVLPRAVVVAPALFVIQWSLVFISFEIKIMLQADQSKQ